MEMHVMRTKLRIISIVCLVLGFGLVGCSKEEKSQEQASSYKPATLEEALAKKPQNIWDLHLIEKGDLQVVNETKLPYSGKVFKLYKKTEVKQYEGLLWNGQRQGLWTEYGEDGTKRSETNYSKGTKLGLETISGKDGWKTETNYRDGKEHGLATVYREGGAKYSETHYKDGKEHGLKTMYRDDGTKKSECEYKDGEKIYGTCKEF